MRILLLGGTAFVGRAIAEDALRSGAQVTLFGRGRTGAGLFPGVPRLTGDRDSGDYAALRGGEWDAVIDVSGYVPRHVGQAMTAIGDSAGRYVFISSHAVYRHEGLGAGAAEDAPRREPLRGTEDLAGDNYGRLKVACEDDVLARYGDRATIVRPGKVAGPHDWQDGLTYWVRCGARGGRVAVPADPAQPVQVIDSRDLARLVVQLAADDRPGAFQAVGPAEPVTLGGLIGMCADVAGTQVELVRVPEDSAPPFFPLVRPYWATQQRSARRPGRPGCRPRRCPSPSRTCWPGTASAASRRLTVGSRLSRRRGCWPASSERDRDAWPQPAGTRRARAGRRERQSGTAQGPDEANPVAALAVVADGNRDAVDLSVAGF